ncbi:DMT family transporter [Silvimonas iriomotensis]|uniref:Guanidinium exporter n=1 Tax=Silvimonas iriomotensis TaxID=449662 RepID=A0ABQ2P5D6_9NEIS|nr:multidrug efflux SMR transporter [Silvimonas iriomotensis]GGP18663.1 membrane protein [Silvimonas iriomotensis]
MSSAVVSWIALIVAGLLEVGWAVALKSSAGFSRLWPSLAFVVLLLGSMGLLAYAVRTLPLGTAYALWTGIGVLGSVLFGVLFWGEPLSLLRAISVILLLAGMVGLKLTA